MTNDKGNPNDEIRMPKEARMTKSALTGCLSWLRRGDMSAEWATQRPECPLFPRFWVFGIRAFFVIRHLSLVIHHSSFSPRHGDPLQNFLDHLGDGHPFDFELRPEN